MDQAALRRMQLLYFFGGLAIIPRDAELRPMTLRPCLSTGLPLSVLCIVSVKAAYTVYNHVKALFKYDNESLKGSAKSLNLYLL